MKKKWEYYDINTNEIEEIKRKYNVSTLVATVISNKNLNSSIDVFLNPTRKDFYDPFLMPDMEIAVERIVKAIKKSEKVIIYGDYDVDGITSITVLKKFLKDRGLEVDSYIPNRLDEGYGLNKNAIDNIVKKQYSLMITVDCGISGIEEIDMRIGKVRFRKL